MARRLLRMEAMSIPVPVLSTPAAHSSGSTGLAATAMAASAAGSKDEHGFSFGDFLDIINPLQHIPVVSTVYRAITGDKIGDAEQVAGDGLYGGLVGLGASIAGLVFKDATGKNLGDTLLSWAEDLTGIHSGADQPTALANAETPKSGTKDAAQIMAANSIAPIQVTAADAPQASTGKTPSTTGATPANSLLADPGAFMAALKTKGVDSELALRAMSAYEKSLGIYVGIKADNTTQKPPQH
jgi:hypothetical protein